VSALPLRLGLAAVAVLLVVLAVGRIGRDDGCTAAGHDALRLARGTTRAIAAGDDRLVRRLEHDCRGGDDLAQAGAALAIGGRTAAAERLAREAIRREPQNFLAWDALALAVRKTDRAEARRAVAAAQRLNPRGRAIPLD
jgi:hypothetical protein